jgi:hypothetical protein
MCRTTLIRAGVLGVLILAGNLAMTLKLDAEPAQAHSPADTEKEQPHK